jgi:hypothetical protein
MKLSEFKNLDNQEEKDKAIVEQLKKNRSICSEYGHEAMLAMRGASPSSEEYVLICTRCHYCLANWKSENQKISSIKVMKQEQSMTDDFWDKEEVDLA